MPNHRRYRLSLLAAILLTLPCAPALAQTLDEINARLEQTFAAGEIVGDDESEAFAAAVVQLADSAPDDATKFSLLSLLLDIASLSSDAADAEIREEFLRRSDEIINSIDDLASVREFLFANIVRPRQWMPASRRAAWSEQFRAWVSRHRESATNPAAQSLLQLVSIEQGIAVTRASLLGVLTDAQRAALLDDITAMRLAHGPDADYLAAYADEIRTLSVGCVIDLQGEDLAGEPLNLADHHGRIVLLSGWATWCAPCIAIFPEERALVDELPASRFTLLGINDDTDRARAAAFAAQHDLNFKSLWSRSAEPTLIDQLAMHGLPAFYVLDGDGRIIARARGGEASTVEYIHEVARGATENQISPR